MTQTSATTAPEPRPYAAELRAPRGYVVGTTGSGVWVTVLGSHWETIPLFTTAAAAEAWYAEKWASNMPGDWYQPATFLVERAGGYFKIVEN